MTTGRTRNATEDGAAETDELPPDIATMRATVARLLGPDGAPEALPPAAGEVDTLTRTMRGQLESLIPDVERRVGGRTKNVSQYCALACIGEARGKLSVEPCPGCPERSPTRGAWPVSSARCATTTSG